MTLKEDVAAFPEGHQEVFKKMHSPGDLTKSIDEIVNSIPEVDLKRVKDEVKRTTTALAQRKECRG
jgi:hypothetical protein